MNKNDFTVWELPQDAIGRLGQGYPNDLAVSADGTSLAVGSWAGVWWYDLTTREPITLFETERGMVNRIVLCTDQPWLAVKNSDKDGNEVIKIWDMQRQERIAVMEHPERFKDEPIRDMLCSLCFSPSGKWLAVSHYDSSIVDIWESLTGRVHAALELPSEEIELCWDDDNGFSWYFTGALAFSSDDHLFASSLGTDFISVWDITTCKRIIRLIGHPEGIHSLSFSPCGQFLAGGGVRGTVKIWNTSTWQLHQGYPSVGDYQMDISYTPDGTLRAAGISHDQTTVTIWDFAWKPKGLYTYQEKNYFDAEIYPIHFSNGKHLALKSDFNVQVKSVGGTEDISILPWELCDLHSLTFSPDGKTLCAGYRGFGGIILWDISTHHPQRIVTEPRCCTIEVYSNSVTGKFYATGYLPGESLFWSNTLNLWEIGQREPIAELTLPGGLPDQRDGMAYAPLANLLACGNGTSAKEWDENDPENGAVYVWDVARGQMRHIFRGKHTDRIIDLKFSPDGTRLVSIDKDNTTRLWDMISGEEIREYPEYSFIDGACEGSVTLHMEGYSMDIDSDMEISPCRKYLAYGEGWHWQQGLEKVPVRLWDIRTGKNIATFLGHPTDVHCVAFSPDSTILASGSHDGTILLWNLKPYLTNT